MQSYVSNMAKRDDEYRCALTRVSSTTAVEGALAVPADEADFVSLINLFNKSCSSNKHYQYMERDIAEQLNPPGPSPPALQDYQKVHDIRNYLTLAPHCGMDLSSYFPR